MLRLEEANVGTEENNHTDDLNMLFAHLSREFPDVTLKSRRTIDQRKCESSSDTSTHISHEQVPEHVQIHNSSLTRFGVGREPDVESVDEQLF